MSKSTRKQSSEFKIAEEILDNLQVRNFQIVISGKLCDAFVMKHDGNFFAYLNECKHLPVPLDMYAATVFNTSKTAFQCHQHGAVYDFQTGLCTEGPCKGATLTALAIEKRGNYLIISPKEV
jgi:nitrite reductase/ring-hydroxylating ferredoxin subunit